MTAAKKHYGELEDVVVTINRETGEISGTHNAEVMDEAEISGKERSESLMPSIVPKPHSRTSPMRHS